MPDWSRPTTSLAGFGLEAPAVLIPDCRPVRGSCDRAKQVTLR